MRQLRHTIAIAAVCILLTVLVPIGVYAQAAPHHQHPIPGVTDSSDITFRLTGQAFFVNDESVGSTRVNGYTLPGFYLRPHIAWSFEKNVELQLGVHWLHFWGYRPSNDDNEEGLIASMLYSRKPSMIVPWLRVSYMPTPELTIVIGSLINENGHGLPLPLYNPERLFAIDPESGFQAILHTSWLTLDIWMDWRHFIWNRSAERETFVMGFSAEPHFNIGDTRLHFPIHGLVQHVGGEGHTDSLESESHYNAALGLGVSRNFGQLKIRTDCMAMIYGRNGSAETEPVYVDNGEGWWYMASPKRNFKHGIGIYPRLTAEWKQLWLETSYWVGEGFVPLLGCYHYSNVSLNTSDMTHDRIQVAALRFSWTWDMNRISTLRLYGTWHHYFPYTADRTGYSKVQGDAADMFSMGLQVSFNPTLNLR